MAGLLYIMRKKGELRLMKNPRKFLVELLHDGLIVAFFVVLSENLEKAVEEVRENFREVVYEFPDAFFIIPAERPPPSGGGCKAHSLKSMVVKHFP